MLITFALQVNLMQFGRAHKSLGKVLFSECYSLLRLFKSLWFNTLGSCVGKEKKGHLGIAKEFRKEKNKNRSNT